MKTIYTVLMSLLLINTRSFANEVMPVNLDRPIILLGFGDGVFPKGTIRSQNGLFEVRVPVGLKIKSSQFIENYDSMCSVRGRSRTQQSAFLFSVGPSSSESSRCVLQLDLANGSKIQILGLFSSGN